MFSLNLLLTMKYLFQLDIQKTQKLYANVKSKLSAHKQHIITFTFSLLWSLMFQCSFICWIFHTLASILLIFYEALDEYSIPEGHKRIISTENCINAAAQTIHTSLIICCLQRVCNDTPSSYFSWRKATTWLFTLNQEIKLFWCLSAHTHILLIAHEVISINNSSCLLQRSHLSHRSNQMSTATLSYGTHTGFIFEYYITEANKVQAAAHNTPVLSWGKVCAQLRL